LIIDKIKGKNSSESILDIQTVNYTPDGKISGMSSYMDNFPFPFYIILRKLSNLPIVLGDALRQCNRGECQTDSDCGSQRNCNNFQCVNPCANACGVNANCEVRNHGAICSCPRGFSGDPFSQCNAEPSRGKRQSSSSNSTVPTSTTASP